MSYTRVTVCIDDEALGQVDRLVAAGRYKSRSAALAAGAELVLRGARRDRLGRALDALAADGDAFADNQLEAEAGFGDWAAAVEEREAS